MRWLHRLGEDRGEFQAEGDRGEGCPCEQDGHGEREADQEGDPSVRVIQGWQAKIDWGWGVLPDMGEKVVRRKGRFGKSGGFGHGFRPDDSGTLSVDNYAV